MLQHGAQTIDADAGSHRAIAKGAPGYQPVVEHSENGSRAQTVRSAAASWAAWSFAIRLPCAKLEQIIHPLVRKAVDVLVKMRASEPVVVIEAIKLLEGDLRKACDSIWVTYAPQVVQIERLTRKRNISRDEALQRINAQAPQTGKIEGSRCCDPQYRFVRRAVEAGYTSLEKARTKHHWAAGNRTCQRHEGRRIHREPRKAKETRKPSRR